MGVKKRFKNRESGIELLRIIAMLLIVLHHEVMHNALPVLDQELSVRKLTLQLFYFTPGKVGIAVVCQMLVSGPGDEKGSSPRIG